MNEQKKTCCFFGHRKIAEKESLEIKLYEIIENLIAEKNVYTFLFGSKSQFDDFSRQVVTKLKEKYSHIKRIYVRAEYPVINDDYKKYLLESYEETYFSKRAINAGKAAYVERNREMIDKSDICVVYYKDSYLPPRKKVAARALFDCQPKSGTGLAYKYAIGKKREIINLAEDV